MSPTTVDEQLSSLDHQYTAAFRRAVEDDDHETVARLSAAYDAKTRRLHTLKDPATSALRRLLVRTRVAFD